MIDMTNLMEGQLKFVEKMTLDEYTEWKIGGLVFVDEYYKCSIVMIPYRDNYPSTGLMYYCFMEDEYNMVSIYHVYSIPHKENSEI